MKQATRLQSVPTADLTKELVARYDEVLVLGIAPKGDGQAVDVSHKPGRAGRLTPILRRLLQNLTESKPQERDCQHALGREFQY